MRLIIALLISPLLWGQAVPTWTTNAGPTLNPPWGNGWQVLRFDAISGCTFIYEANNNSTIYSNALYCWKPGSPNTLTPIWNDGSSVDTCVFDTTTSPGNRHPVGQWAVDNTRGLLWMTGGPNQNCNGGSVTVGGAGNLTVTNNSIPGSFNTGNSNWSGAPLIIGGNSCTISSDHRRYASSIIVFLYRGWHVYGQLSGTEHAPRPDTYYLKLNSVPTTNTWTQVIYGSSPLLHGGGDRLRPRR